MEHVLRHRNKMANDLANAAVDQRCEVTLKTTIGPSVTDAASDGKRARK
jgi:hypothetical protein